MGDGADYQGRRDDLELALRDLAVDSPIRLRVAGNSMRPALEHGSWVVVSPSRVYWPGDVLAFPGPGGQLFVHRLVGYRPTRRGLRLVTKGDACLGVDDPVAPASVLGRVVAVIGGEAPFRTTARQRLASAREFVLGGVRALFRRVS